MNIYLLTRADAEEMSGHYDYHDSCVVAAADANDALNVADEALHSCDTPTWPPSHMVRISLIGRSNVPRGIVIASFNAG